MQNGVFWDITHAACVGCWLQQVLFLVTDSCHPDERGAKFLLNVGSYKSHTA
jgi:hypothetical protein